MIAAIRAAIPKPQCNFFHLESVFFHSTPILQRKHQSNSKARNKKSGKERAKQDLRRNVNDFAEHLFGIWSDGFDFSGKHTSWYEKQYSRVCKRNRNGRRHIPQRLDKRCFDFYGVDEGYEIDYFLRSALGGSFYKEEESHSWRYSNNSGRSWDSRQRVHEEEEEKQEQEQEEDDEYKFSGSDSNEKSHRQALGLSSSGPLNLQHVKNAYRACALKWHPDRHQDSTKIAAEEKFKLCTVAYQSLCEKLAMH